MKLYVCLFGVLLIFKSLDKTKALELTENDYGIEPQEPEESPPTIQNLGEIIYSIYLNMDKSQKPISI